MYQTIAYKLHSMKISMVIKETYNPNKEEENVCILVFLSEGLLFLLGCFCLRFVVLWLKHFDVTNVTPLLDLTAAVQHHWPLWECICDETAHYDRSVSEIAHRDPVVMDGDVRCKLCYLYLSVFQFSVFLSL